MCVYETFTYGSFLVVALPRGLHLTITPVWLGRKSGDNLHVGKRLGKMNWMTSGRHRALRSKRGKKRGEMRFPLHVQQREQARLRRHPLVQQSVAEAREKRGAADGTPWYIRTIKNDYESHDVQMLEMTRANAKDTHETDGCIEAHDRIESMGFRPPDDPHAPAKSTDVPAKVMPTRRCVFTPVKTARSRKATVQTTMRAALKMTSPPPRKDLLFFDQGEAIKAAGHEQNEVKENAHPYQVCQREESTSDALKPNLMLEHDLGAKQEESSLLRPFYLSSPSSSSASSDTRIFRPICVHEEARSVLDEAATWYHPSSLRVYESQMLDRESTRTRLKSPKTDRSSLTSSSSKICHRPMIFANASEPSTRRIQAPTPVHAAAGSTPLSASVHQRSTWCDQPSFNSMNDTRKSNLVTLSRDLTEQEDELNKISSSANSEAMSQSPALLPPLGWQKNLGTKPGLSGQDPPSPSRGVDDFVAINTHFGASSGWKCSRRTDSIIKRFASRREVEDNDAEVQRLKLRFHEELGINIYLSTLLACYRIDEQIGFMQPDCRGIISSEEACATTSIASAS